MNALQMLSQLENLSRIHPENGPGEPWDENDISRIQTGVDELSRQINSCEHLSVSAKTILKRLFSSIDVAVYDQSSSYRNYFDDALSILKYSVDNPPGLTYPESSMPLGTSLSRRRLVRG